MQCVIAQQAATATQHMPLVPLAAVAAVPVVERASAGESAQPRKSEDDERGAVKNRPSFAKCTREPTS